MKNVVFDLGGVLIHWNPQAVLEFLRQQDPHFPKAVSLVTLEPIWAEFDRGRVTQEEVISALSERLPRASVEAFVAESMKRLRPLPEGVALLHKAMAAGYHPYFLSNMPKEFHEHMKNACKDLFQAFHGGIFSYRVGLLKPEVAIYEKLFSTYSIDPKESIFIDDLERNVTAAKSCGMHAILCEDPAIVSSLPLWQSK